MKSLTPSEQQMMEVLWNSTLPMCVGEIEDNVHTYKTSSRYILLNGLIRKGLITEVGTVKRKKTYARTFVPTISREQYWARLAMEQEYQPETARLVYEILKASDHNKAGILLALDLVKEQVESE